MSKTPILSHQQIERKLVRIAHQIYESHWGETELVLAGIVGNGFVMAKQLAHVLATISPLRITLTEVHLDKKDPLAGVTTSIEALSYQNTAIVLVDDVLNSGKTLMYGACHFLQEPIKRLTTAVLVDRSHKKYPITADFRGIFLSTSLQEQVQVIFEDDNNGAYLQ